MFGLITINFFYGEGGRLRLMPNNKPLVQNSTLVQSSPRVAAKPTTPSTRRIFMTKCMYYNNNNLFKHYYISFTLGPDGKTRLVTTPKTIITDNVINQNSLQIQSTNPQLLTSKSLLIY